jgi:CheY-like chemotaxis protein
MQGVTFDAAVSGTHGLDLAKAGGFDVVLVDLQMADLSGYQVAERMSMMLASRPPKIIAMSAYELDPARRGLFGGFLAKPFRAADLLTHLAK